jgi:DNA-binding beta-propeller fold protein YncE
MMSQTEQMLLQDEGFRQSYVAGDSINIGDIYGSYIAIGRGAQVVVQQALSAAEEAERQHQVETQVLARAVVSYIQKLTVHISQPAANIAAAEPYKSLLPYRIADAPLFFGRSRAKADLLRQISAGNSLIILHSESGAGKTSLLQAGLAAELLAWERLPVYVRVWRDSPTQAIKQTLLPDLAERTPGLAGLRLRPFLSRVSEVLGLSMVIYILLDQFEDFFVRVAEEDRSEFIAELGECLEDQTLPVQFVISLRDEHFANLSDFRGRIPYIFAHEYPLKLFSRTEAAEVIAEPARLSGLSYEPGLAGEILDQLQGEGERGAIMPAQLQLVCWALYRQLNAAPEAVITRQMLETTGGVPGILQNYLRNVLNREIPPARRQEAQKILESLVRSDRTRDIQTATQLTGRLGSAETLADLVNSRLLRLVDDTEEAQAYELAHDYLVEQIHLDPEVLARKAAQEMLDQEVALWRRNPALRIGEEKLKVIEAQAAQIIFAPEAQELYDLSRKARRLRRGIWATLVGGILMLFYLALLFYNKEAIAQANLNVFQEALLTATSVIQSAQDAAALAENRQFIAQEKEATAVAAAAHANAQVTVAVEAGATAEAARQIAEARQATALSAQATAEAAGQQADTARQTAQAGKADALSAQATAEAAGLLADTARQTAQAGEAAALAARQTAEAQRAQAEEAAAAARQAQAEAEAARQAAEEAQEEAERAKQEAEDSYATAQAGQATAAAQATVAVATAAAAENNRTTAEAAVTAAVATAAAAENNRTTAEAAATVALATATADLATSDANRATAQAAAATAEAEATAVQATAQAAAATADAQLAESQQELQETERITQILRDTQDCPVGGRPDALAYDGVNIWVTDKLSKTVTKLSPSDCTSPLGVFPTSSAPSDIIYALDSIWVTTRDNKVTRMSLAGTVLATFDAGPPGSWPATLLYAGDALWVASWQTNKIRKLDPNTGAVLGDYSTGRMPSDLAYDGDYIWIANFDDNTLSRLDAETGASPGTVAVGGKPVWLLYVGGHIWVANQAGDTITKLRATDRVVVDTFDTGDFPDALAFDGVDIWAVHQGDNTLSRFGYNTGTVLTTLRTGRTPTAMLFDGANMWVVCEDDGIVQKIPITINLTGQEPMALAYDGSYIWVANHDDNTVSQMAAANGTLLETFGVFTRPNALAIAAANLWVANSNNTVSKLRRADGTNLGTFAVGEQPAALAYDGTYIWVANKASNTVTRLREADGSQATTFPVGSQPVDILFDGDYIWVANWSGQSLLRLSQDGTHGPLYNLPVKPESFLDDGHGYFWVGYVVSGATGLLQIRASDGSQVSNTAGSGVDLLPPPAVAYDGTYLWLSNSTTTKQSSVIRFGASQPTNRADFPVCAKPSDLVNAGGQIWVACKADGMIQRLPGNVPSSPPTSPQQTPVEQKLYYLPLLLR